MPYYEVDVYGKLTGAYASSQITPSFVFKNDTDQDVQIFFAVKNKKDEMASLCRVDIMSSIQSDVLVPGTPYTYPTSELDQQNMIAVREWASLLDGAQTYKFWCADENGVWARRAHTDVQITSVAIAMATHVAERQDHYAAKLSEIAIAAQDPVDPIAAVQAITW